MTSKKPDRKPTARPRPTLASALLVSTVRGATRTPLPDEPWRNKKSKGKSSGGK